MRTLPTVAIARLDAVLKEQYRHILPPRRREILRHCYHTSTSILLPHLVMKLLDLGWTAPQAQALAAACTKGTA